MLVIALRLEAHPHNALRWAGWLMFAGIVLFSGSLYLLTLGGPRWLGPVTPVGGVAFITGWFAMVWATWRRS